jgi:hypothetical protein
MQFTRRQNSFATSPPYLGLCASLHLGRQSCLQLDACYAFSLGGAFCVFTSFDKVVHDSFFSEALAAANYPTDHRHII